MVRVRVNAGRIRDWESFHRVFRETMGFPGSYGDDMDAWIECMSNPGVLTRVPVESGDVLVIEFLRSVGFRSRCPEQFAELVEGVAYVNLRRVEEGQLAPLALSFL
jgi:RNAse (barnase) inhibitor barstar